MNNPNKRAVVKNMVKEWKYNLVFLHETKIYNIEQKYIVRSIWGNPLVGWMAVEVAHTAGGILLT